MQEQGAPFHRDAKKAVALLLTINLFNYIDRQILAAVAPPLAAEFHLSDAQFGLLSTAFLY